MRNSFIYVFIFLFGVFISSFSQVLLKKSANKNYSNFLKEYLNIRVIIAYFLFFSATVFSTLAYKVIPLSFGPILESVGYIFVLILSYFILKEKITKKKVMGIVIILIGIFIFTLF